jgi:hypothetical protein
MITIKEGILHIEIHTDKPGHYLHELQSALNNMIASVAESPELNQYKEIPEALYKLRELQSELMLTPAQIDKLREEQ